MRRGTLLGAMLLLVVGLTAQVALAGSPHFVGQTSIARHGDDLIVSGKIAGLGNEEQVQVRVTALAECINPGNNKPQASNKESVSAEGTFPVQNGKANFTLTLTASLSPNCSPPMTIRWSNVLVEDLTHGISQFFPGPF